MLWSKDDLDSRDPEQGASKTARGDSQRVSKEDGVLK